MVETFVQSTDDVVRFLKDQHNLIKDLFEEVFSASSDDARRTAFTELRQLLAVHETAEEMIVHPRARGEGAAGDEVVDARLAEEHRAKEMLAALEDTDVAAPEFLPALAEFRDAVVEHADAEEAEEFDSLRRDLDAGQLKAMAAAVRAAEAIAPTRPHPGVESATLTFAVGPFASMLDRARDAIGAALR